jgi:hypothetical protein
MNDMAFLCEDAIADAGASPRWTSGRPTTARRNVNSALGYERPIDLVIARAAR